MYVYPAADQQLEVRDLFTLQYGGPSRVTANSSRIDSAGRRKASSITPATLRDKVAYYSLFK